MNLKNLIENSLNKIIKSVENEFTKHSSYIVNKNSTKREYVISQYRKGKEKINPYNKEDFYKYLSREINNKRVRQIFFSLTSDNIRSTTDFDIEEILVKDFIDINDINNLLSQIKIVSNEEIKESKFSLYFNLFFETDVLDEVDVYVKLLNKELDSLKIFQISQTIKFKITKLF